MSVSEHMSARVRGVTADSSLREVVKLLATNRISCAVVYDQERPVGIITERDLVRIIDEDRDRWWQQTAGAAMTQPLHVTKPATSVIEASRELGRLHVRRLPVVTAEGRLCGIVTQTDLLRASHRHLEEYAEDLERLVRERTAELRESEQRRNDLVDLTVHDIKNWLTVTDASLQMLVENSDHAATLVPLLRNSTSRIAELVCTLLDVNRLEDGSMPVRFRNMPWSELCDPIVAELKVVAQAKSVTIAQAGESRAIVRCDPSLIARVLLNLLDNAISAAPEESTVEVHTSRGNNGAFVATVGNRGPVIPREVLPQLFRKYRQQLRHDAGESPLKRFGGWGLGLTFCQLALALHGSTIRAISPYVDGEGAAFEFTLPVDPEQEVLRIKSGAACAP